MLLEKVTELGASRIIPLITQHTQHKIFNREKALEVLKQATEQSHRLGLPVMDNITKIEVFLRNFDYNRKLLVGNARLDGSRLDDLLEEKCVFLVGPEGGFSNSEQGLFEHYNFVRSFSFGSNVLKSETAAIAFVSMWIGKFL
jgi:16S rRNA (uracil1498-N3)-methyltransferase